MRWAKHQEQQNACKASWSWTAHSQAGGNVKKHRKPYQPLCLHSQDRAEKPTLGLSWCGEKGQGTVFKWNSTEVDEFSIRDLESVIFQDKITMPYDRVLWTGCSTDRTSQYGKDDRQGTRSENTENGVEPVPRANSENRARGMWGAEERLIIGRLQRKLTGTYRKMVEVWDEKNRAKKRKESKCPHVFSAETGWLALALKMLEILEADKQAGNAFGREQSCDCLCYSMLIQCYSAKSCTKLSVLPTEHYSLICFDYHHL